jgi:two-component system, cell cycle response regulator
MTATEGGDLVSYQSTILIVDDSLVLRSMLHELLQQAGYRLLLAATGAEALELAALNLPDLILLDVVLPDLDGFEVCRRLRAHPHLAHVPIMMLTALDDRDSRLAGIRAGADDFISKPFDQIELGARVRTITRLNRYRRLQNERARFEWVVERARDGYLIVNGRDEILYANTQALRYLGLPSGERAPIAGTFLALASRAYLCRPEESWSNWPHAADEPRYLLLPETDTTAAFWLNVTRLALPDGDEQTWVIHLQDVTAQMAQQRDTWKLHRAVTHKLRTPLIGVLNGLELLARQGATGMRHDAAEDVAVAYKGAQNLKRVVEEVLQYAEASTLAHSGDGFPFECLADLAGGIGHELGAERVSVHLSDSLDNLATRLSARSFEMIMRELFENAVKFHPLNRPAITVTARRISAARAEVRVCDDGRSLPPGQLAQVGTPHYQAEKQFTGQVPGFGLGLATVTAMVWEAGGACRFANCEPGPGMSVELVLPIVSDERPLEAMPLFSSGCAAACARATQPIVEPVG